MEAHAHAHSTARAQRIWDSAGSCAESRPSQDGAFSEELPPRLRCPDGAEGAGTNQRMGRRSRDRYTGLNEGWRRRRRGEGEKDAEPRGLQREAAKSRGRRLLSGPLAVALAERSGGTCWPRHSLRRTAALRCGQVLCGVVLAQCWGSVRYVNIWPVVRHYPLTRVRIPAAITSTIHRLSRFDGKKQSRKKETTLQLLPGPVLSLWRISCYCSARPAAATIACCSIA